MAINSYLRSGFSVESVSNVGRKQTEKTLCTMLRLTIIIIILTFFGCKSEDEKIDIKFGQSPKCQSDKWLTFEYDVATYYYDTSGTMYKYVYHNGDSTINVYRKSHVGKILSADNVKDLDAILSCKMYCGTPDDSIASGLVDPRDLIVFTKGDKLTGYVATNFYDLSIYSLPSTNTTDLCALKYLFQTIRQR
jgi:hypothetical protein